MSDPQRATPGWPPRHYFGRPYTRGHAALMLTNETTGEFKTYSLCDDSPEDGFPVFPGMDIRPGVEGGDNPSRFGWKYTVPISISQKWVLDEEVSKDVTWHFWRNCASWASETFYKVTGIDVDADDYGFGLFETPRELADSIDDLNGYRGF